MQNTIYNHVFSSRLSLHFDSKVLSGLENGLCQNSLVLLNHYEISETFKNMYWVGE